MTATTTNRAVELASTARKLMRTALNRPTVLDDEYINWLALVNAGMQHPGNYQLFDLAIRTAPEAPMLEIGSFCGLSTNIIQYLKRKHGRTDLLYTCDRWLFEGSDKPLPAAAGATHNDLHDFAKDSFVRALRMLSPSDLPHTIELTSDEFFAAWARRDEVVDVFGGNATLGGEIGFCFIDGNHTEPFAQRDFENTDCWLAPGGLILFDDSSDESDWEVKKVIERIKTDDRYTLVAKNPNYLFRKTAA